MSNIKDRNLVYPIGIRTAIQYYITEQNPILKAKNPGQLYTDRNEVSIINWFVYNNCYFNSLGN